MEREDLFFGLDQADNRKNSVFALVIYDISDNKVRLKFSRYLDGYGSRIQKSAYEIKTSQAKYKKMLQGIPSFCAESDSIRVYKLTSRSEVAKWGKDLSTDIEDVILI